MLFALYLAELGEGLVKSGLGVKVGDVVVPGLFYADDMVVMGQGEGDLRDRVVENDRGIWERMEFVKEQGSKHRKEK